MQLAMSSSPATLVHPGHHDTAPSLRNPCPWCRTETGTLIGLLDHIAVQHQYDLGTDPLPH